MEIQAVETFPLYVPLSEPYGDANGYKTYRSSYIICIRTRSGLEGWGECAGWLPVLEKAFQESIIPFLVGKKSSDRMELVEKVKKLYPGAAAGVSMALTEILAKKAGVHVCDLWGGARRREVPVYASFQSYTERADWRQHSLNLVEAALTDGFTRIKVKIGAKSFQEDYEHIDALQRMVDNRVKVAVDANESYDVSTALRWNSLFTQWDNWLWFEEPLPMDYVSEYALLRSNCVIPLSGGENVQGHRRSRYVSGGVAACTALRVACQPPLLRWITVPLVRCICNGVSRGVEQDGGGEHRTGGMGRNGKSPQHLAVHSAG